MMVAIEMLMAATTMEEEEEAVMVAATETPYRSQRSLMCVTELRYVCFN
jgi:hypothetical protein